MQFGSDSISGWRGAALVTIAYVYFLIFAQFAFLKRLANPGTADAHLKLVMAAMAGGGILLSLLAPRLCRWPSAVLRLRAALLASASAAMFALVPLNYPAALAIAFLIGAGLGLLTVTLATHLRLWTGDRNPLLAVGVGTGVGYLICNFPPLFTASAATRSVTAGLLCLAGIGITLSHAPAPAMIPKVKTQPSITRFPISFFPVLAGFTALVWLDSAAFFIIQNTPALKAGTWQGTSHLWVNGLLHLAAALASAWLLRMRGIATVLTTAFLALGAACLLLHDPGRALTASLFYPIGVSLYSVALVAYPSVLAPAATVAERGRIAGWIYAVAGWFGSAMGIGMAQHLGHVPAAFVVAAGAVILSVAAPGMLRGNSRELALTALLLCAAGLEEWILPAEPARAPVSQAEQGRQVYISEGCIHCHSQYVRPGTSDVLMWGPAEPIAALRDQRPPLIGNRRQGPDLSEVGARRSPLWLRAHFFNPAQVSGASIMPSYGFLFRDQRGDDLIAYLESLRGPGTAQHIAQEKDWEPSPEAIAEASSSDGQRLYQRDCATCHDTSGPTRLSWRSSFKQLPTNLLSGPFHYLASPALSPKRGKDLAEIVKFGIPGTDMAGHESMSDRDVASLTLWLSQNGVPSAPQNSTTTR